MTYTHTHIHIYIITRIRKNTSCSSHPKWLCVWIGSKGTGMCPGWVPPISKAKFGNKVLTWQVKIAQSIPKPLLVFAGLWWMYWGDEGNNQSHIKQIPSVYASMMYCLKPLGEVNKATFMLTKSSSEEIPNKYNISVHFVTAWTNSNVDTFFVDCKAKVYIILHRYIYKRCQFVYLLVCHIHAPVMFYCISPGSNHVHGCVCTYLFDFMVLP